MEGQKGSGKCRFQTAQRAEPPLTLQLGFVQRLFGLCPWSEAGTNRKSQSGGSGISHFSLCNREQALLSSWQNRSSDRVQDVRLASGGGPEDETCVLGMWGRLGSQRLAAGSSLPRHRMFCALSSGTGNHWWTKLLKAQPLGSPVLTLAPVQPVISPFPLDPCLPCPQPCSQGFICL